MRFQQGKVVILGKQAIIEGQPVWVQIQIKIVWMDVMDHQRFHHDSSTLRGHEYIVQANRRKKQNPRTQDIDTFFIF